MKRTSLADCKEEVHEEAGFAFRRKRLGAAAGGVGIGTSFIEVAPGNKAFPFHFHLANEEAVFVLEGAGVLRLGEEEHPIRAGDYLAFPPGPPGHQILNRAQSPLRLLAISTMLDPEVVLYPDSKKIAARCFREGIVSIHRQGDAVTYYEGEK